MKFATRELIVWKSVRGDFEICVRELPRHINAHHINAVERARIAFNRGIVAEARALLGEDGWAQAVEDQQRKAHGYLVAEFQAAEREGRTNGLTLESLRTDPELVATQAAIRALSMECYDLALSPEYRAAAIAYCQTAIVDHRGYTDGDDNPVPFDPAAIESLYVEADRGIGVSLLVNLVDAIVRANALTEAEKKTSHSPSGSASATPDTSPGLTTTAQTAPTPPASSAAAHASA